MATLTLFTDHAPATPVGAAEAALAGACRLLGAAAVGGPLSDAEEALLRASLRDAGGDTAALAAQIRQGADPLGAQFCRVRSADARRPLGQFYTDPVIVAAMVEAVLAREPARVIDCGCGSGRFTTALLEAGYAGEVIAVDIDPLATLMLRASLAPRAENDRVRVENDDFLSIPLPPNDGLTAFIGNPPYVRHHDLSSHAKMRGRDLGRHFGIKVSGLSGLHALFMLQAVALSRPGDIGCFITSAEWLDVGYGAAVRGLLTGAAGLERLDIIDPRSIAFDDAMASAVICSWSVGHTAGAKVREVASRDDLEHLSGGRSVSRKTLTEASRWSGLARRPAAGKVGYTPLGQIARVHRGIATGSNEFFVMTRDRAIELDIIRWTSPCLTKAVQVQGDRIDPAGVQHVILDLPATLPDDEAVRAYVRSGEERGVPERYLCAHRSPWWRVGGKDAADIVATYMARQPPRFALNGAGVRTLNTVHGIYFRDEVAVETKQALVSWLNENAASFVGRTYHGGLTKFEPSEMESILTPPLATLSR